MRLGVVKGEMVILPRLITVQILLQKHASFSGHVVDDLWPDRLMNQRHLPMWSNEGYHWNPFIGCDTHIKSQDLRVSVMCASKHQNSVQVNEL